MSETSLARQLKKLATPQTSLLLQDKVRASLLFDPKEASGLDRDIVFAYGATGFDKLLQNNASFGDFQSILFSEISKNFERSVQDAKVNKNLDKKINNFLTMLSPYVLLKAAHEALEWLIYRFRIHMFNVNALIACVIPHYHTRIFVRVIQLLDLRSESNEWHWLTYVQKSGKPLELSLLLHQFNSNSGFRKFVCDQAGNVLKMHSKNPSCCQTIVSFSTVTTYYALKQQQNLNESYFTFLLPYIIKGLKSNVNCYIAGSYMIIATLITKVKVIKSVLIEVILEILTNAPDCLMQSALELILLIYQQQPIKSVPMQVITHLIANQNVTTLLYQVSADYPNSKFCKRVITSSFQSVFKNVIMKLQNKKLIFFLNSMLKCSYMKEKDVSVYLCLIVNLYLKYRGGCDKKLNKLFIRLPTLFIECLQNRFPGYFDYCVELYFKQNLTQRQKKAALILLNKGISKFKHHVLNDSGLTIYLALNNPIVAIRLDAVERLVQYVQQNKVNDISFVETALLDRITDDNPDIVLQILSLKENLFNFIPQEVLIPILYEALMKCSTTKSESHWNMCLSILKFLCAHPYGVNNLNFFSALVPFLLPMSANDKQFMTIILASKIADEHPFLQVIKETCSSLLDNDSSLDILNHAVLQSIHQAAGQISKDVRNSVFTYFTQTPDFYKVHNRSILFTLSLLRSMYMIEESSDMKVAVINTSLRYIEKLFAFDRISNDAPTTTMDAAIDVCMVSFSNEEYVPIQVILYALRKMIQDIEKPITRSKWWQSSEPVFQITKNLFIFLMKFSNSMKFTLSFRSLLGIFMQQVFENMNELFLFLSYFWTFHGTDSNNKMNIAILYICKAFCCENKVREWFLNMDFVGFSSLLVVLGSSDDLVRQTSFEFLDDLLNPLATGSIFPLKKLGEFISTHKEEINTDHEQLAYVIGSWLQPAAIAYDFVKGACIKQEHSDTQVFQWLIDLVCDESTPYSITNIVLKILQSADAFKLLHKFVPTLKHYLTIYEESKNPLNSEQLSVIQLLLLNFSTHSSGILTTNSDELNLLISMIKMTVKYGGQLDTTVQSMALSAVRSVFEKLSTEVQHSLLHTLLEMCITLESSQICGPINKTLRKLCIYAHLVIEQLPENKDEGADKASIKERRKSKKQRTESFSAELLEKMAWKKIIVLLEIIQNKKRLENKEKLITELFRILDLTLDWDSQPSVEYIWQLSLSSIHNCCSQFATGELQKSEFQIELIIKCIRSSNNFKTHHQALLVLNSAAIMFPDYLLDDIMSIFTFMGDSLVQKDDSYSFQVIYRTIETIVPALQQACDQNGADTPQGMASIIRNFVNAIPHIPSHRQLHLFSKLINTLGPSDYLWFPLAQICERYASTSNFYDTYSLKSINKEISPILELAITLHEQFPIGIQLDTCYNLVHHLISLPVLVKGKRQNVLEKKKRIVQPFDVPSHTDKDLQNYKRNILCYLNKWLSSSSLVSLLSEVDHHAICLEGQFKLLLEEAINYLKILSSAKKEGQVNSSDQLLLLYDLVQNINALLPSKMFIKLIKKLLVNPLYDIRLKAVEILSAKLEFHQKFISRDQYCSLLKLLKPLLCIVSSDTASKDMELIKQNALVSIHLMCKIIGTEYRMKFHKVLLPIIKILCNESDNSKLIVNALLCLAELSTCLNALVLPHLSSFMPEIIKLMEKIDSVQLGGKQSSNNEYVILSLVIALQGLVSNLGAFMNIYMVSIFSGICTLNMQSAKYGKPLLQEKLDELCKTVSSEIPLRIFIPAAQESHIELLDRSPSAVGPLAALLSQRISKAELLDIVNYIAPLQEFFINLLDFRNSVSLASELVSAIEEKIIDSLLSLVMKMSEPTFQTFFSQVYLWAVPSSLDKDAKDNELRVLTFYRLTCHLSKNLKTLFIIPAKKIFRHCATMLEGNKSDATYFQSREDSVMLLKYIVETLNTCFEYDDGHLTEKEYFDVLMQPLVDQIENTLQEDDDAYQDYIENYLSQCLGHFISLFSDNVLWKAMNHQVLLKTKHTSSKVRFAALQVIREMVKRMGDNYLVLLPESIPFLAEVMEDESYEVEQECQDVISEMERILGEPIKKYF